MKMELVSSVFLAILCSGSVFGAKRYEKDILPTKDGDLEITFLGHGSLLFTLNGMVIAVDPYSQVAEYALLPKADLILVTHQHYDHLDLDAIQPIRTGKTVIVANMAATEKVFGAVVLKNGEERTFRGVRTDAPEIRVAAVPAYNLVHMRDPGVPYHPKGEGNGYVLTFGDKRVYVAGDTENISEMRELAGIDVAFLPMNLPYTMTPEMVADAARRFRPKILYPYHFGDTDTSRLAELLKDEKGIEVRIRGNMK